MGVKTKKIAQYELVPPEGGWGYVIAASLTVVMIVTVIPMSAFGLIFGKFLANVGDETTGTALANGLFNTILSFTGLATNHLLQKYSYRNVGLAGALLFFMGAFSTIFVNSTYQIIVSFGIIQGFGFGLMMPSSFTAFNSYFDKKINLVMGIAQAVMVAANMVFPSIAKCMMDYYGFRGTVALVAAISLHSFPAMMVLQPIEWHLKKKPILTQTNEDEENQPKETVELKVVKQPLLEKKLEEGKLHEYQSYIAPKQRFSIISMGERAMSVTTINHLDHENEEKLTLWQSVTKSMDLSLFKDPVYINITCGISLAFTADVVFISLIPLILYNSGYSSSDIALTITIYFGTDFIARLLQSTLVAFVPVKNRHLFLIGSIGSAIFRIGFTLYDSYVWKMSMCACLGFLRSLIQTPLPLVISEKYSDNFASAFSLYMVVGGVCSLIFGPLISFVKSVTKSDVMVLHVLTMGYVICAVTWTAELIFTRSKNQTKK